MIRLTLNSGSLPEIHLFNKESILVSTDPSSADLILNLPNSPDLISLNLVEKNGSWSVVNGSNNPFVCINKQSFGKRIIHSGDVISIDDLTILFENLSSQVISDSTQKVVDKSFNPSDNDESRALSTDHEFNLPFAEGVDLLQGEEWKDPVYLEKYVQELENKFNTPQREIFSAENGEQKSESSKDSSKPSNSLKDDYLKDLEDENPKNKHLPQFDLSSEPNHLFQAWKWILLFIFFLVLISTAVCTVIYYSISDKTEAYVVKASQGTADIAMALTYAQISQTKPHNQNWSDIEFLKSNLQKLLVDTPSFASKLDAHGEFHCCPYTLRIYTNSDLSHFILIAQPAPTLLYWLIPRPIIVIDSHLMDLRTLKDVRSVNRLLANADPLDGANGKELTSLVKQGQIISLKTLAQESDLLEFAPPESLALLKQNAENIIYNAPRYYRLGQGIIRKAINLATAKGSSQDVGALKEEIENIAWLKNLVLYSIQGKTSAEQTRQGLKMFVPSSNLFFGYILFNHQSQIYQAELIPDEEMPKDFNAQPIPELTEQSMEIALESENQKESTEDKLTEATNETSIDHNHPIYIQLQVLVISRDQELKPLSQRFIQQINQELNSPDPRFQQQFQELSQEFLLVNAKHKQEIREKIAILYNQYEDLSAHVFLNFLKELHLEHLMQNDDECLNMINENCHQNVETLVGHIARSKNLEELNNFTKMTTIWLNFDYIKDPKKLIKYQTNLRNQVLKQMENFLLSPTKHLDLVEEDRTHLNEILNQEKLINPEEKDFFLAEFDYVVNQNKEL